MQLEGGGCEGTLQPQDQWSQVIEPRDDTQGSSLRSWHEFLYSHHPVRTRHDLGCYCPMYHRSKNVFVLDPGTYVSVCLHLCMCGMSVYIYICSIYVCVHV